MKTFNIDLLLAASIPSSASRVFFNVSATFFNTTGSGIASSRASFIGAIAGIPNLIPTNCSPFTSPSSSNVGSFLNLIFGIALPGSNPKGLDNALEISPVSDSRLGISIPDIPFATPSASKVGCGLNRLVTPPRAPRFPDNALPISSCKLISSGSAAFAASNITLADASTCS